MNKKRLNQKEIEQQKELGQFKIHIAYQDHLDKKITLSDFKTQCISIIEDFANVLLNQPENIGD